MSKFQAHCRGYVTRKQFDRRKVSEVAVRTIQRNVRSYFDRSKWPWWKLFTHVIPLVETHKTEQELKDATVRINTHIFEFMHIPKEFLSRDFFNVFKKKVEIFKEILKFSI